MIESKPFSFLIVRYNPSIQHSLMEYKTEHKKAGPRILRTAFPNASKSKKNYASQKEDKFLNLLQKHSEELVMVIDEDGKVKYCSPSLTKILGYDSFRLIGNSVRRIIPVKQWVAFRAAMRASDQKAEQSIFIDCQLIDVEDKKQFFSISFRDYRSNPQIEGYIIYAKNIDRLKRQESKLKLRNLAVELIKEAVVIIDPQKRSFLYANKAFYDLSGFTPREILGGELNLFRLPYSDMLFDEQTDTKAKEKFFKALRKRTKFKGRIYSRRKNGTTFYNRFSLMPVFDSEGQLSHYIATLKEIQPRRRLIN